MCVGKNLDLDVAKIEDHVPEDKRHKMDDAIGACTAPSVTAATDNCDLVYRKFKCFFEHLNN